MADMLRPGTADHLSPEARAQNHYESLYYRAVSGDDTFDHLAPYHLQAAYENAEASDDVHDILKAGYINAANAISNDGALAASQQDSIRTRFDAFASDHSDFAERFETSFENRYGQRLDGSQINQDQPSFQTQQIEMELPANAIINGMAHTEPVSDTASKIARHKESQPASRAESRAERARIQEKYDDYARRLSDNASKYETAGTDYGFDEPEITTPVVNQNVDQSRRVHQSVKRTPEPEDDGPEL